MSTTLLSTYARLLPNRNDHIEVSMPLGAGECFYVMVDNYFQGQIVKSLDGWLPCIKSEVLTGDDVGVILDIINEQYPHPSNKTK